MSGYGSKLIRLRADPRRVRVSVRKSIGGWWRITIEGRGADKLVQHATRRPAQGMQRALKLAELAGIEGIDRELQWTYEHPQYEEPI